MAIPFLNNINLDDNQLLNAKLHVTSSAPTAAAGQIYFDSTAGVTSAKYYDGSAWISLIQHTYNNGTFINLTEAGTDATRALTADLSATGTPDATVYLRGDNTWSPISAIPGTYTWDVSDGTNTETVGSGFELIFAGTGGTTTSYNSGSRTLTIDSGNETITLTGEVTGSGTTSISTTVANGVLDVANFNASAIVIESEGIENNDNDTTLPTSAAVKAYVDAATVGGLVYQGGYDANLNSPDLTTSPNSILKGWTYTVTAPGTFFGEQLRVGDVLIAEVDDPSSLADWTTVQNNIDLASLTQVGIGNVNAGTGISVSYSNGTATVTNTETNSANSFSTTITDTGTVNYPPTFTATRDVIVQLYDTITYETVYADVERTSTTQLTVTFASTPTNSIKVLVQKIG